MEPTTTHQFFEYDSGYSDVIVANILPLFSFKDLAQFSEVSTSCYAFRQDYYNYRKNRTEETLKKVITEGCFSSFSAKQTLFSMKTFSTDQKYYSLNINRSAITRTDIFFHTSFANTTASSYISTDRIDVQKKKLFEKIVLQNKLANKIVKITPYGNNLYVLAEKLYLKTDNLEAKSILIYDIDRTIMERTQSRIYKHILLPLDGNDFLEVYGDELFANGGLGIIQVYDRITTEFKDPLDFDITDERNRIVGIKINNDRLYVRLALGSIKIVDLKTKEILNTIQGPDCATTQEHFEIIGNHLFTAEQEQCVVTKWEFSTEEETLEKRDQISYFDENTICDPSSSRGFTFQIDGTLLYLGLPYKPIQVWDCDTLEFCRELYSVDNLEVAPSKFKIHSFFVNEGVLVVILRKEASRFKEVGYRYEITNFNQDLNVEREVEPTDTRRTEGSKSSWSLKRLFSYKRK